MARELGAFNFSGSLEVKRTSPLDARTLVKTASELTNKATWLDSDGNCWLYNGIVVTVTDEAGQYMLLNYDPTDSSKAKAYETAGNWKRIDAKGATTTTVIDNLNSTSSSAALSANQGKVLSDRIGELSTSLSVVYKYKGSCTYAELVKKTNANVGDVWNVTNANGNIPAGTNYACYLKDNGSKGWDALGGSIDLSNYVTSGQLKIVSDNLGTLKTTVSKHTETLTELDTQVKDNHNQLVVNTQNIKNLTTGLSTTNGNITKLTTRVKTLETNTGELTQRLDTVDQTLTTLKGSETQTGSIKNTATSIANKTVTDALTWIEVDDTQNGHSLSPGLAMDSSSSNWGNND